MIKISKFRAIQLLTIITLLLSIFHWNPVNGQVIQNGCVQSNFGIDADINANGSQFGNAIGIPNTDDWFFDPLVYMGSGLNVIDTTGAYGYQIQLQNYQDISFLQRMSTPLNTIVNGNRWLDAVYIRDYFNNDQTGFSSSKNGDDPNTWNGGPSSVNNKGDLVDCFAHIRRNGLAATDDLWFYAGFSRVGNSGSSYLDVEIYVNEFTFSQGPGFYSAGTDGGHTAWKFNPDGSTAQIGDLALSATFGNGAPEIEVRIWVEKVDWENVTPQDFSFGANFDGFPFGYADVILTSNQIACGLSNLAPGSTPGPPWGTTDSGNNYSTTYDNEQFLEIGINMTNIGIDPFINGGDACDAPFSAIIFKSRTSGSFSSSLQDFAGPTSFGKIPADPIAIVGDTITCINSPATLSSNNLNPSGFYQWSTTDGNILGDMDTTFIQVDQPGTYYLYGAPFEGCTGELDSFYVGIDTIPPTVFITGDTIWDCNVPIQLFGGEAGQIYNWFGPGGFTSNDQNPLVSLPGKYTLQVTSVTNGCLSDTLQASASFVVLSEPCETDDLITLLEDGNTTYDVLLNDTDLDNNVDPTTTTVINGPSNGTLTNTDGVITYTPNPDYNGTDSFDYIICDSDNLCDTANVSLNINPVCDLLDAGIVVACDDNGTGNTADDTFTFTLSPTGNDLGTTYSISGDATNTSLPYGSASTSFGPYLITNGDLDITISDDTDNACQLSNVVVTPPTPCSICDVAIPNVTFVDLSACGVADGSITITASSTYAMEYSIDGGVTWSTNTNFTNLGAGSYIIQVRNVDGSCLQPYSANPIIMTEPGGPLITGTSSVDPSCPFDANDGTITVHALVAGDVLEYSIDNGITFQTDSVFVNLAPGSYSVIVQSQIGGCATVFVNNTIDLAFPFCPEICNDGIDNDGNGLVDCDDPNCSPDINISSISNFNGLEVSCNGGTDGTVTVSPNSGTGPFTYLWDDPLAQTSATATGLGAGIYSVTITDAFNCMDTLQVTFDEPTAITSTSSTSDYNGFNVSCNGGNDGTATVVPTGGIPPYSYLWDDLAAQTTETATNLVAGNYNVTITDANNCELIQNITLTEPTNPINITFTSNNVLCFGDANGSLDLTVTGGVPGYTYSWNDGSSTEDLLNLNGGTYTVTVTDANNCTAVQTIIITEPSLIDISITTNIITTCSGSDGSITVIATGGSGSYEYSLDGIIWQSSNLFPTLSQGTFNVFVRNADGTCATAYTGNSVVIQDPPIPQVAITTQNVTCNGLSDGAATIAPVSGALPFSYSWPSGSTNSSETGLAGGTYMVTITDMNNCFIVEPVTIIDPAPITFTLFSIDPTICTAADGLINVSATGGAGLFEYSMDNITWQTSNSFRFLMVGSYDIYVRNVDGTCVAPSQNIILTSVTDISCPIDIPVPPPIELQINSSNSSASNASCGDGYDWTTHSNTAISDDNYAIVDLPKSRASSCLNLSNFNFNIPIGATIMGIEVNAEGHYEGAKYVQDQSVRLHMNGISTGENKAYKLWNLNTDENWIYGGNTDLWGTTLTENDINDPNFGVIIQVKAEGGGGNPNTNRGMAFLDQVAITVYYQPLHSICISATQSFSSAAVTGATNYNWIPPAGSLISSGQGTTNVVLDLNGIASGVYDICVVAQSACADSDPCCYTFEAIACPEVCDNGIDDDEDGTTDCLDNDCIPTINNVISSPATCPTGSNNGSININAFALSDSLNYSIDGGTTFQSDSIFTNLAPGTYNVVVRNEIGGCLTNYTSNPIIFSPPSCTEVCNDGLDNDGNGNADCLDSNCIPTFIDVSYTESSCPIGTNNGTIDITAVLLSGDTLEYSIDGITYQLSNQFANVAPGNYNIFARNKLGGCVANYANNPVVLSVPVCAEDCTDNIDNDGDGLIDCNDPDCVPDIVNIFNTQANCPANTNDGIIEIIATIASGPLEYSINDGFTYQSSNTFNNLVPGDYMVRVRNISGGCEAIFAFNPVRIFNPYCPEICNDGIDNDGDTFIDCDDPDCPQSLNDVTFTVPNCPFDANDGTISIDATSTINAIEYSINGGASFQPDSIFTNLTPGNYNVEIRSIIGNCIRAFDGNPVVLPVPNCPEICNDGIDNDGNGIIDCEDVFCNPIIDSILFSQPQCPINANNGTIRIFSSIGSGETLQYSIDGGINFSSNNLFTNLSPGNYDVVVANATNTCDTMDINSILLIAPICNENCTDGIDNDGDGLSDCADSDCAPIVSNIASTNPTCPFNNNDGTILISSNLISGDSLEFSIDGGNTYQLDSLFTALTPGNYSIFVRNKAGGCTTSYNFNPVILDAPICPEICNDGIDNDGNGFSDCDDSECNPIVTNVLSSDPACPANNNNGSIVISANLLNGDSLEYSIDGGTSYQADSLFTSLGAGSYNILVRNIIGGCIGNYPANPVTLASPICPEICNDGIDNNGNGSIDCDDMYCIPSIDSVSVMQPVCPFGSSTGSISIASNLMSGDSVSYSIDGGMTYQADSVFTGLLAGNYSIIVRNTAQACLYSYTNNPVVLSEPTCTEICNDNIDNDGDGMTDCFDEECLPSIADVLTTPLTNCNQGNATIDIQLVNAIGNYEFSINNGQDWESQNVFTNIESGVYHILVRNTQSLCEVPYLLNPIIFQPIQNPVIDGITTIAPSDCQFSDASLAINAINYDTTALLYSIDGGQNYSTEYSFNNIIAGTYEVVIQNENLTCSDTSVVTILDPGNCTDTLFVTINENNPLDTCLTSLINLPGNINQVELCEDPENVIVDYDNLPCLVISSENGFVGIDDFCMVYCDDTNACDTIIVIVEVEEVLLPPIAEDECVDIEVTNNPVNVNVLKNDIINGDLVDIDFIKLPSFGNAEIDDFDFSVNYTPFTTTCGQTDTFSYFIDNGIAVDTALICVEILCTDIVIHNGFSPNNDGTNDTFVIENIEHFPGNQLSIYNRWGNQVAKLDDYQNDWDGSWLDTDLADGTYFYYLVLPDGREYSGYVVIFR